MTPPSLHQYCFEPSKCKAIILSRKRNPSTPDLFFGTTKILLSEQIDVLGLRIDSKLTWTSHLSNICRRAGQRLGALRKLANKLDAKGRANIYKTQVRSIMEYALAQQQYAISNLSHRRTVAATTVLFKMHTPGCPVDLKALLPQAHTSQVQSPGGYFQATHWQPQSQTPNASIEVFSTLL